MAEFQAIIMKANDNVGTAIEAIAAGTETAVRRGGETLRIKVTQPIPFGHKFALRDIRQGDPVIKYGEIIGLATQDIQAGQHVHVHNLESCRGRGDK